MSSLDNQIVSIKEQMGLLYKKIQQHTSNGVDKDLNGLMSELTYFSSYIDEKVDDFEKINTKLLLKISNLNKETAIKQTHFKRLKTIELSSQNLTKGLEVALEDNRINYTSVVRSISVKAIFLTGVFLLSRQV